MTAIILELSIDEDIYTIYEEYVNSLYVTGKMITSTGQIIEHVLEETAQKLAERQESEWPVFIGDPIDKPLQPPIDALINSSVSVL